VGTAWERRTLKQPDSIHPLADAKLVSGCQVSGRFMGQPRGLPVTERHRSRTCLASGYDAVLVLKTSWGTGPSRSAADTTSFPCSGVTGLAAERT
jgi:hypothetical protein